MYYQTIVNLPHNFSKKKRDCLKFKFHVKFISWQKDLLIRYLSAGRTERFNIAFTKY